MNIFIYKIKIVLNHTVIALRKYGPINSPLSKPVLGINYASMLLFLFSFSYSTRTQRAFGDRFPFSSHADRPIYHYYRKNATEGSHFNKLGFTFIGDTNIDRFCYYKSLVCENRSSGCLLYAANFNVNLTYSPIRYAF